MDPANLGVILGRRLGRLEVSSEEVKTCLSKVEDRCSTVEKALLREHQVSEKRDERVTELERMVDMLEQKLEKFVVKERENTVNAIDAASNNQCLKTDEKFSELKQKLEKMEHEKDREMKEKDQLREQLAVLTKDHMELSCNLLEVVETCQQSEVNMMRLEQKNVELTKEVKQLKEGLLEDSCEASLIESDIDSSYAEYDPTLQLVPVAPPLVGYQLMCPTPSFPHQAFSYCPIPRARGIQHFNPPVYFSNFGQSGVQPTQNFQ